MSNGQLKIGIVEDEFIIAENLRASLSKMGYQVAKLAINYEQATSLIQDESIDLFILDINLNESRSGIDVAKSLNAQNRPFIFLSSYSDPKTISDTKGLHPLAYLTKPFERNTLYTTIEIAVENHLHLSGKRKVTKSPSVPRILFLKKGSTYHKVPHSEIIYMMADGNYLELFTDLGRFVVRNSIQKQLDSMKNPSFMQVHRGYAINLNRLSELTATEVILEGTQIPLSRSYKADLQQRLDALKA